MNIITGSARGTKLLSLEGDSTRPTSQRVKEAIFSIIQFEIEQENVLDLFAGSGQLGFEALSRGCVHCDFCDSSKQAMDIVKANAKKTHFEEKSSFFISDWKSFILSHTQNSYGLVFLDAPYSSALNVDALRLLYENGMLAEGCIIVSESGSEESFIADGIEKIKSSRYSISCLSIYRYKKKE